MCHDIHHNDTRYNGIQDSELYFDSKRECRPESLSISIDNHDAERRIFLLLRW
jgi:hypothetical protein